MYAVKEMYRSVVSEQIIYLSQHTLKGDWHWVVLDSVRVSGVERDRAMAWHKAMIAALWVDVQYWRSQARPKSKRSLTENKIDVLAAVKSNPGLSAVQCSDLLGISYPTAKRSLEEWQALGEVECRKGYRGKFLWYPVKKSD